MTNRIPGWLALTLVAALLLSILPAAVLAAPATPVAQQSDAASDVLTPDALANMTYISELTPSGEATLVDGKYEDVDNRILVTLATAPIAYGTLDGQDAAAVLIVENGGGSGIFVNLAVVVDQEGTPVNVASTLLGDRVDVTSLAIDDDQVNLELIRQGPGDPMCCPTELARVSYTLDGDQLVAADETVLGQGPQVVVYEAPEGGMQITIVPPAPYEAGTAAMPTGAPLHTMVSFLGPDPTAAQSDGGPFLAVYPADEYVQLWQDAGDATIADLVSGLQSTLADQPATLDAPLPIVPPATGVDTAAQVSYLTGDGYRGVRFVAQSTLGGEPTGNEQLSYYFSGLTDDGRYLIGAQWPVATTAAADALDSAADDEWTPTLSSLDTAFASLIIQGPGPTLTIDDLGNMEYQSMLLEKPVLLTNGIYTETVVPDSATGVTSVQLLETPMALGYVDGFESAAVLIVENGGGTGQFVTLALVQDVGGTPVNTANTFLGDRPNVTNLAIDADGSITVDMIQVGPNDAFCCANMPMTVTYVKTGDQLVMRDQASATIDTTGYEGQVTAAVVQPTAYDNTMPPSGQGEPKHFTWTLGDTSDPGSMTGYVSVYPVEAYLAIWELQGDSFVSDTLAQLETLLSEQPADPAPPMPVLPQVGATNDFAAQVAYLDLPGGGNGVRFIGRFVQDVSPIENFQLRYIFQGLTNDGQTLVVASIPVTTTALPAEPQSMSGDEYNEFAANYESYLAETTATFNALASTDFAPDLAVLDAILQSVTPEASTNPLAPDSLANMEYSSELASDGVALLENGVYTESVAPDSASMIEIRLLPAPIAYGTLDDQDSAAVLLAESGGGSGTFIVLAVVQAPEGTPVNVANAPLGDRVQVQSLAIADNQITVEMLAQGPDDPMCCPSQQTTQVYELQGDTLALVDETTSSMESDSSASTLAGTTWVWSQTQMNDDTLKTPAVEGAFTLTFNDDGTAGATTDCNTYSGSYTEEGGSLAIELPAATLMACPDDSQEQEFIADVTSINSYIVTEEGDLALLLPFDSGSMIFTPGTGEATGEGAMTEEPADDTAAEAPAAGLAGTAWNWVQTQYANDTIAAPADPTLYVLTFGTDGTVSMQDDCNVLNGTFTEGENGELTIDLQTSTMAACAPESLHDQFVLDLAGVASYLLQDGSMFAAIKYDTGIMEFAPAP